MDKRILPMMLALLALALSSCLQGGSESVRASGEAAMVFSTGSHR